MTSQQWFAQLVAMLIGGATGGWSAMYAAQGAISWWLVAGVFAWPFAVYVHAALLAQPARPCNPGDTNHE